MSLADFNSDSDDGDVGPKRKIEDETVFLNSKKFCKSDDLIEKQQFGCDGTENNEKNRGVMTRRKVVERQFPGPAGLLISNNANCERQSWKDFSINTSVNQMEILCSQGSVAAFSSPIWKRMLQDFETGHFLLEKSNIEWIKKKAAQKEFVEQKAPFLAAIIQSIEPSFNTVTLFLKDPTGEIQGHIPCKLYKKHKNELVVGAVIILKQPAVLTLNFGESHYLILTANNLLQIYYPTKHKNDVSTIKLQNFTHDELLLLISQVKTANINKTTKENEIKNPQKTVVNNLQINENRSQTNESSKTKIMVDSCCKGKFDFKSVRKNELNQKQSSLDNVSGASLSQIVIKSQNPAHEKILQTVFDGVDVDSFFGDF